MTAAHYKGGHPPGNDLGLHYTALPPIVASCPYSDQLLVTRKFWSPRANRPSQVRRLGTGENGLAAGGNRIRTIGPAVEERPFRRPTSVSVPTARIGEIP